MTYALRLNIDQIYIEAADRHWEQAKKEMTDVDDVDLRASMRTRFRAAASPTGIAASVQAVAG